MKELVLKADPDELDTLREDDPDGWDCWDFALVSGRMEGGARTRYLEGGTGKWSTQSEDRYEILREDGEGLLRILRKMRESIPSLTAFLREDGEETSLEF